MEKNMLITRNPDGTYHVELVMTGTGDTIPIFEMDVEYIQQDGDIITTI